MYAEIVTAILIATAPGQTPEPVAAFFGPEGPQLCAKLSTQQNDTGTETLYVCETARHG